MKKEKQRKDVVPNPTGNRNGTNKWLRAVARPCLGMARPPAPGAVKKNIKKKSQKRSRDSTPESKRGRKVDDDPNRGVETKLRTMRPEGFGGGEVFLLTYTGHRSSGFREKTEQQINSTISVRHHHFFWIFSRGLRVDMCPLLTPRSFCFGIERNGG